MNSVLKTLTKSELLDIVRDGISSEIVKHETARKKAERAKRIKNNMDKIKSIRIRNPFCFKQ